jgi:hypothetical protein
LLFSTTSRPAPGSLSPLFDGYWSSFEGVKQQGG